jgi:hypothetical protein
MPENEQMTHSQHFISKMYFRQFSENKKNIYRYDANDLDKPPETRQSLTKNKSIQKAQNMV